MIICNESFASLKQVWPPLNCRIVLTSLEGLRASTAWGHANTLQSDFSLDYASSQPFRGALLLVFLLSGCIIKWAWASATNLWPGIFLQDFLVERFMVPITPSQTDRPPFDCSYDVVIMECFCLVRPQNISQNTWVIVKVFLENMRWDFACLGSLPRMPFLCSHFLAFMIVEA